MFPLHSHSNHSFLRGTIPPETLVNTAFESKLDYSVLTDTDGMYGLIQFAKLCGEAGIKPVLGSQITDPDNKDIYAIFLAKNINGYSELNKIITTRKLKDDFSLKEIIENISDNLFVISHSLELIKNIRFTPLLKKNVYAELISAEGEKRKTRELYDFCVAKDLKYIASAPLYFLKKEDILLHKVVRAIDENTTLDNIPEDKLVNKEYYFQKPEEFKKKWSSLPLALKNIDEIVKQCNVDLELGIYKFPVFPLPEGEDSITRLWKLSFEGLERLYHPVTEKARERLKYELDVITELGFADYFLIVWDIVREAKRRNMMLIGRGSAANSLVAYCLGFTQVDPIEQNLYFERFLNRGRKSPPDVDLDFSWRERDEIVKYVYEKYGYDKVAFISTKVTFRARSAFREVAKVFGFSEREISKYSKFIPWTSAKNLPELAKKFPESRSLNFDVEPWKTIINLASQLSGFPRHLSIHPSGIVITQKPITNYLALEYAKNKGLGLIVTQPDMYPIEDYGLIKIDLLSQRSLGVLKDTLNRIKK